MQTMCSFDYFSYEIKQTNYINFYDYYISEYNTTYKTIDVKTEVIDGQEFKYLTTKEIQLNSKYNKLMENEKILILNDKSVFEKKYKNCYITFQVIGEGSFGKVVNLFAIKIMKIDSK